MNGDEKKGSFRLDYSAPTDDERREIESIREKYLPQKESATKMDRLRALDAKITSTARAAALSLGIAGTLIFGLGMCMVLEWSVVAGGVVVSVLGAAVAACAHPLHTFLLRRGKEKYGDEIIKLSGELLGDDRRDVSRTDASDDRSRTDGNNDGNNDGNDVRGSEE